MRIIDKNTDFYDYLQTLYPDNSNVFDRTDSYVLTKEEVCRYVSYFYDRHRSGWHCYNNKYYCFMLLQVGNVFWLFLLELTEIDSHDIVKDYTMTLLSTWKDYNKPRKLIEFCIIDFPFGIKNPLSINSMYYMDGYDLAKLQSNVKLLIDAISQNDCFIKHKFDFCRIYVGNTEVVRHIPLP